MAANRADRIAKTYKILKKHYTPVPAPPERSVLEHLLYACCLENAPYDKADAAFQRIRDISFDWNEVRVTAVGEIAESMIGYPEPRRSALFTPPPSVGCFIRRKLGRSKNLARWTKTFRAKSAP